MEGLVRPREVPSPRPGHPDTKGLELPATSVSCPDPAASQAQPGRVQVKAIVWPSPLASCPAVGTENGSKSPCVSLELCWFLSQVHAAHSEKPKCTVRYHQQALQNTCTYMAVRYHREALQTPAAPRVPWACDGSRNLPCRLWEVHPDVPSLDNLSGAQRYR